MSIDPIEKLIAESEIRNVVARLGHLADHGDLDEYISLFTDDATWGGATPYGTISGKESLLAGAQQRRTDGIQGPGSGSRHQNTTLWVNVESSTEATAQSYILFLTTGEDGVKVQFTGCYNDRFAKTPDGWKLAARDIVAEVN